MYGFYDKAGALHQLCFLDMPKEIRDMIYGWTSAVVLEPPVHLAYLPPAQSMQEHEPTIPSPVMQYYYGMMAQRRGPHHDTRWALLGVRKQIYQEAKWYFYKAVSLNFRFALLQSSSPKVTRMMLSAQDKLQFITHIKLDFFMASFFLFTAANDQEFIAMHQEDWAADCLSLPDTTKKLARFRTLMYNVQSATIYPSEAPRRVALGMENEAVGNDIIVMLATLGYRTAVSRMFPRLTDIVASNRYGVERYRKIPRNQDEGWELWYSKEPMPTTLRDDFDQSDPRLYDMSTGLTIGTTLAVVGVVPAEDDGENDDS